MRERVGKENTQLSANKSPYLRNGQYMTKFTMTD